MIGASGGSVNEVYISRTTATQPDPNLTLEAVPAAIERALDRTGATPFPDGGDFIYDFVKPYEKTPRTASTATATSANRTT